MAKRIVFTVLGLALVGACAVFWARTRVAPTLSLQPLAAGAATSAWPGDQYWNWAFAMPDPQLGERIALRIRQKSRPLPAGTSPVIACFEKAMPSAEADREFGTSMIVTRDRESRKLAAKASVQLLDLSDIGAASTTPGQTLRVLAKLSIGGAATQLAGDDAVLPAGRFAGQSHRGDGHWVNGELYLMSFWVQSEGSLIQYDVFLEQSADRPAH